MHPLHVPLWVWAVTVTALILVVCADLAASVRRPREVRLREATLWVAAVVALAVAFGIGLAWLRHPAAAGQFFAGWLTEYSLSLDNLFVFVLLISRSAVPRELHSRVLLLGVALALLLRGIFIALGASALHRFGWLLYIFGGFLLYTAVRLAFSPRRGQRDTDGGIPRAVQRVMRVSAGPKGSSVLKVHTRRRLATPLVVLVIAIAVADIAFAFDSIPAIFGLTREPYLVFTANMFALLGLRHLYFLIGGLLGQLAHLAVGLSAILAFIGVKLITTALLESGISQLGLVPVPHIGTGVSLAVIAGVITTVTVSSLVAGGRRKRTGRPAPPGDAAPLSDLPRPESP